MSPQELRIWLFKNDISIKKFASEIKICPTYLQSIMKGKVLPGVKVAKKIEEVTKGDIKIDFSKKYLVKKSMNHICNRKTHQKVYNQKYQRYFCVECDIWLKTCCDIKNCDNCSKSIPERPSMCPETEKQLRPLKRLKGMGNF